jgi:hypothetical protein
LQASCSSWAMQASLKEISKPFSLSAVHVTFGARICQLGLPFWCTLSNNVD